MSNCDAIVGATCTHVIAEHILPYVEESIFHWKVNIGGTAADFNLLSYSHIGKEFFMVLRNKAMPVRVLISAPESANK